MKAILLTGLSGLAIFFGTPMLNEYAFDPCAAYNRMAIRTGAPTIAMATTPADPLGGKNIGQILQGAAKGQVPQIKPAAPAAPPDPMVGLTCTTRYWQHLTGIGKA